ncbi:MAG: PEP-CTERM sorting domain-containing protein [Phycisphaerales bacterium]
MTIRTMICAAGALTMLAGTASADVVSATGLSVNGTQINQAVAPGAGVKVASLQDIRHFAAQGSGSNKVIKLDIGAGNFEVTGLSWDLSSWAFTPAALSDMKFSIVNSSGDGITFTPYPGNGASGAGSTSGSINLNALSFDVTDGMIFIELWTARNLIAGPEGSHTSDSILELDVSRVVPAPGSFALMGLGGLAVARRRRR